MLELQAQPDVPAVASRAATLERPTILVVSTNADRAGAPTHVRDLVESLSDRFAFTVVFGEDGPIREALARRDVPTLLLPGLHSRISPVTDLRVVLALRRIILQVQPSLVHAHSSKAGLVARLAGRLARVPVVYTVHGWGFGEGRPRGQSAFVRLTERLLSPLTSAYIAVSRADADLGRSALQIAGQRLHVVPNGVADSPWRASPGQAAGFAMVARASFQKDHECALRAFAQLPGDATFTCIGGGTDAPAFRADAARWGGPAAGRIHCLGARADVGELLAGSGAFVLASRYEGMPLSILEAMRCGLPVVASRVGGVGELVADGVTGFLTPPGDVAALAAAMARLAADPGLRRRLGEAGRQRYERDFSLARMSAQVATLYHAIGRPHPAAP